MIDDTTKDEVRRRTDLFELCEALGLEPKGKVARCPAHNDDGRPNLAIYPDHVYCFVCEFHADAFDLVAKVKGLPFTESFDFLAGRLGLPLIGDLRKSDLGNKGRDSKPKPYPKPGAPLPSPSPATVKPDRDPGAKGQEMAGNGSLSTTAGADRPWLPFGVSQDDRPWLPFDLWRYFETFAEANAYFAKVEAYHRCLGRDPDNGRFFVRGLNQVLQPGDRRRPSLRTEVFDALLAAGLPASATPAGAWLSSEKGITTATQDRFGLVYLEDWKTAAGDLKTRFGLDALLDLGVYGLDKEKKPYFVFARHRLLFPFRWKGQPVDCQGRNVEADAKGDRFRNTASANPLPYNADALATAKATGKPVFICEGATDTLALAQSGRPAVGIVGTGGFKAAWLPYFEGVPVYLALDADEAGQRAALALAKTFTAAGHRPPKVVKLPAGVKDVNQFFLMERETK